MQISSYERATGVTVCEVSRMKLAKVDNGQTLDGIGNIRSDSLIRIFVHFMPQVLKEAQLSFLVGLCLIVAEQS